MKKIRLGENFNSFLIPQVDIPYVARPIREGHYELWADHITPGAVSLGVGDMIKFEVRTAGYLK